MIWIKLKNWKPWRLNLLLWYSNVLITSPSSFNRNLKIIYSSYSQNRPNQSFCFITKHPYWVQSRRTLVTPNNRNLVGTITLKQPLETSMQPRAVGSFLIWVRSTRAHQGVEEDQIQVSIYRLQAIWKDSASTLSLIDQFYLKTLKSNWSKPKRHRCLRAKISSQLISSVSEKW
jgi:hypothetical protein